MGAISAKATLGRLRDDSKGNPAGSNVAPAFFPAIGPSAKRVKLTILGLCRNETELMGMV